MYADEVRELLLGCSTVTEDTPFGPEVLVYKVAGKMFALLAIDDTPVRMNLKCDPDRALDLRDRHEAIIPGYHMNKKHWNTLVLDGSLQEALIRELIGHSYELVVAGLPKKAREKVRAKVGLCALDARRSTS